ncbi:LLM class flavin-dependent oxidoreductase [Gordonia sp. LSe1-13]|uniref:LLM class flavin-dependent oxidoreductase n=1 Tax=Gordonia sesuvii TaxID=3116777 RepID=A0ABU7MJ45_9ACTN|nr:LLM class flavin-dependent oxidoreductase [Gordonia sp. LSe1-13]
MTTTPNDSSSTEVKMGVLLSGWLDPAAGRPSEHIARMVSRAQEAEANHFSSVWVGQHILAEPWPTIDTSVYLSHLAAGTSLDLGGVYLLPLAHPVRLAESLVSLDHVSGGRLIFGAALGWAPREFAAMNVPMKQRVGRFEETLDVVRQLFTSDEPFDYHGKYLDFEGLKMTARPERPGGIPVWVGGSTPPGVRRAARLGDTWIGSSHSAFPALRELSAEFESARAELGRPATRRPLLRHCLVAETDELARKRFADSHEAYYKALGSWGMNNRTIGSSANEATEQREIVGSPDTVIEQISQYIEAGFNDFIFQVGAPGTPDDAVSESMKLLGDVVLPKLQPSLT